MTVPPATTVSATDAGGGPTAVPLTAGSYTPTLFIAHLVTRLNAVMSETWSGSISTTTGLATLDCAGTWALTFTTAEVGTVLGFVGNIASGSVAVTGTQNARGLWLPDCPLNMDGDPDRAPECTDARSTEGPTGTVVTLIGNTKYKHRNLMWSHVTRARTWEGSATTTYASWQQWVRDTQHGSGHTWFSPGSAFQVYWDNNGTDRIVGYDLNAGAGPTAGWSASPSLARLEPRKVGDGWLGLWAIEIPGIVTSG